MSILKNLRKKQQPTMEIRKAAQMMSNVKKLIDMKLLHVDLSTRKFSLRPELFAGKDNQFKSNWCRAVARFWNATTGQESKTEAFAVCDLETGEQLGEFSFAHSSFRNFSNEGGLASAVQEAKKAGFFNPNAHSDEQLR